MPSRAAFRSGRNSRAILLLMRSGQSGLRSNIAIVDLHHDAPFLPNNTRHIVRINEDCAITVSFGGLASPQVRAVLQHLGRCFLGDGS